MSRICKILGIQKPVIQAPMAWITSAELVSAVSNAGGLGVFGACAGFKKQINTVEGTIEEMRKVIRKTKKLTNKPFGMNVSPLIDDPLGFSKATIQLCKEEGIKILACAGTHSPKDIRKWKEEGFTVIMREANPSIRHAIEAEKAGVDIIVATGCDNGGWIPINPNSTISMVSLISKAVKIPVVGSGGIINGDIAKAVAAVGSEGAYVGTRFILSKECHVHQNVKKEILNAHSDDLIVFTNFNGFARWRVLPYKFGKDALKENKKGNLNPPLGSLFLPFINGEMDKGSIMINNVSSLVNSIDSCEEIVNEIAKAFNY